MSDVEKNKERKIEEILFMVKMLSLFFAAIGYFRYFFIEFPTRGQSQIFNSVNTATVFGILATVYFLWIFFDRKEKQTESLFYQIAQPTVFIVFFLGAILATGGYKSNFKYLFLFLIVSYTIEYGLKSGTIIATVSSSIVLALDFIYAPKSGVNYYFEDDISLIGLFFIIAFTIGYYVKIERAHIDKLNSLVIKDGLTGLYNHRYFHEFLKKNVLESVEKNQQLSLLLCDMDYFKQYNDVHGHQMGDQLLKNVAQFLTENLDEKHYVFRYGGDEFAIMLINTNNEDAYKIAETIRNTFSNHHFNGQEYMPNENITISIGVATYMKETSAYIDLLKAADEALYKAKYFRKNRVEAYKSILDDLHTREGNNDDNSKTIASIKTLIAVINSRDQYTFSHLQRVVTYCEAIAQDFGLSEKQKKILLYGAYMHDIGKIDVPKEIMMKVGALTTEEWAELKLHPAIGTRIIQEIDSLKEVVPLILQHHERFDGTGYPDRLDGSQTEYLSRILTVVDSFDAMTSSRPYQVQKSFQEGLSELRRCSGSQFDPLIVEMFISSIEKMNLSDKDILT